VHADLVEFFDWWWAMNSKMAKTRLLIKDVGFNLKKNRENAFIVSIPKKDGKRLSTI